LPARVARRPVAPLGMTNREGSC